MTEVKRFPTPLRYGVLRISVKVLGVGGQHAIDGFGARDHTALGVGASVLPLGS